MPSELQQILLLSIFNPAVILVAFLLGRRADQPQKIVIAAFVAGLAGTAFAGALMLVGMTAAGPRLLSGVFIAGGVIGILAAWLGYRARPHRT